MKRMLFQKSMFVVALMFILPNVVKAQEPLQFAVISDVHFDDGIGGGANVRVSNALRNLTAHGNLDALAVCGDLSQTGDASEFAMFRDCFLNKENFSCPNTFEYILMMGNHDNIQGNYQAFMDVLSVFNNDEPYPLNTYRVIKGYPFISISMRTADIDDWGRVSVGWKAYPASATDFLKEALERATVECPDKPIFVFTHVPLRRTCYATWPELESDWSMGVLSPILNQYPQTVVFTGHSHYPIGDPRSIHQGANPKSSNKNYFTSINAGTSTYSEISTPRVDEGIHPQGYTQVSEGLIVRENRDGDIEIIRLDTRRNIEIDPEHRWVLKTPFDGSQFCYGDVRDSYDNPNKITLRDGLPAPTFGDAKLDIRASATSAVVKIPQAKDENCVFCYHVRLKTDGSSIMEGSVFSQFYLNTDMPDTISYTLNNLKPGHTYDVVVTAIDSYENASEPITATFVAEEIHPEAQQVPAAAGVWNFDDPEDPMACSEGTLTLLPANCNYGLTVRETIAEAGIEWCDGIKMGDGAICLPDNACLYMPLEREKAVDTYTIKWDVNLSSADNYNAILQTNIENGDDADLFTYKGQIGIGVTGYFGYVQGGTWMRIVMVNNGGKASLYINGVTMFENVECDRWNIDPKGVLFFCDENGERINTRVTGIAFWDEPLTEAQVYGLGGVDVVTRMDASFANGKFTDNRIFDLMGRMVKDKQALPSGLYIQSGKKWFVK
mgnify:CR=1 FL=1